MKKILMSVLVIAVVASVAVVGISGAWFSEIESTGDGAMSPGANYYVAGTIELDDIGGVVEVTDLKPCEVGWGYIELHNGGENDGNAWLHFANVIGEENGVTDAEQQAYEDLAEDVAGIDEMIRNDLERVTVVDMGIDYDQDRTIDTWILTEAMGWTLAELECLWIPLGELVVCDYVWVWISFHIDEDAGNEFQSDKVTFDLEVLLQQSGAPAPDNEGPPSDMRFLRMENKNPAGWLILDDDMYGTLTFDCKKVTFDYTFEGYGLNSSKEYNLIYYADGWPGDNPGKLLACGLTPNAAGRISHTGSMNIGFDLPHPSDGNHPYGAKIWLVTKGDYNSNTCATGPMSGWSVTDYLFETRLITYDDTDA